MDKSGFRNLLKKYTKEIKKELSELKVIGDTDIEKKSDDVDFAYHKHFEKLNDLIRAKPNSVSRIDPDLTKYEILLKELQDLQSELTHKVLEKRNQKQKEQQNKDYQLKSSHCSYCKKKPPTNYYIYSTKNKELKSRKRTTDPYKKEYLFCSETHFEKWHKKNYYTCAECNKEFYDGNYKYNKKQSDSQKFCSDNCYYQHYAETCDNCLEKCVSSYKGKVTGLAQTYYSDAENKTGTLCSKCHQEQLKEEAEEKKKDKEWEENFKKLDKNMDDLVDGMVEAVGNNDNDSDDVNNSNNNNSYRERERTNSNQYEPITVWNF